MKQAGVAAGEFKQGFELFRGKVELGIDAGKNFLNIAMVQFGNRQFLGNI